MAPVPSITQTLNHTFDILRKLLFSYSYDITIYARRSLISLCINGEREKSLQEVWKPRRITHRSSASLVAVSTKFQGEHYQV